MFQVNLLEIRLTDPLSHPDESSGHSDKVTIAPRRVFDEGNVVTIKGRADLVRIPQRCRAFRDYNLSLACKTVINSRRGLLVLYFRKTTPISYLWLDLGKAG